MIRYSPQAEMLIKNLKDFDRVAFEKWFFENPPIGSTNVLEYLLHKEKINKEKEKKDGA